MSLVKTSLRATRERARLLRFEPTGAITETNVQKAIEQVSTTPKAIQPTNIGVADSPYAVLVTDSLIFVDTSGGAVTINLLAAAAMLGVPIEIKDVSGNALANNITINRAAAETIDGGASFVINADFGAVRLLPRGGVGYSVGP